MGMALKADVEQQCRKSGTSQPIDLVFLSSRTMGDRVLEHEILTIFEAQLPHYVDSIVNAGDELELYKASHTLKGAAQSVGANGLAEIAVDLEGGKVGLIDKLKSEAERVALYIRELES